MSKHPYVLTHIYKPFPWSAGGTLLTDYTSPLPSFGLIATEKGFNIFVAGNGGASPRHAEILAKDVPPAEVVPILDRYLMFYIRTADRLQRTARWLESLPGGISYLRDVVLSDKLGICASLEAQMAELVDGYFDEWAEALRSPAIAARFRQFDNTGERVQNVEVEEDRGQARPVHWAKEPARQDFKGLRARWSSTAWQPVIEASHFNGADDLPSGISATVKRGDTQLAMWRIRGRYYATQQMCPHKRAFVLSDGLVGEELREDSAAASAPWISCPHHKRNYDLSGGACNNDGELSIATFEVEERADGLVYLRLPPVEELDAELGTTRWKVKKGEGKGQFEELDKKIKFVGQRAKRPGAKKTHVELSMRKPVELMSGGACGVGLEW